MQFSVSVHLDVGRGRFLTMSFEWAPLLSLQGFVENGVSKVFYQLPLMSNWNLVSERTDNIITMLFRSLNGHLCIAEDLLKSRMSRYFSKILLLSHQGHFPECAFFFCFTVNLISRYTEATTALCCHFTVPLILTASHTCDTSTAEGPFDWTCCPILELNPPPTIS